MTARTSHALGAAAVLFCIMAAHALLETARDALFLARLGPDRLAVAYLAIAAVALVAVTLLRRGGAARGPRRVLVGLLGAAAVGTAMLAVWIPRAPSFVFVLYLWTGLVATLVVPTFWLVVDRSLGLTDARRAFAVIGAGGGLGALAGSALAVGLARVLPPELLVTAGALVLGIATIVAAMFAPRDRATAAPRRRDGRDVARAAVVARSSRHVRLLIVLGLVSTVTLTLGDLMFKRVVAERIDPGELATVFGASYAALNVLGLVIQLVVTTRLLDRMGVGGALTLLPLLVLGTTLGFAATGALIAVIALKLGDGGLRHSVHRVASELLILPLSPAIRDAARPAIDALGHRVGQACAAGVTLLAGSGAAGTAVLPVAIAGSVVLWLAVISWTRRSYVAQLRDTLDAGEIPRDVRVPTLDGDAVAMLTDALASPDEAEAAAAIDLLGRRGARIPALVLYHPSPAIVRRALAQLDGAVRGDVERVLGHLTTHPDPQIRAAALAAASRTRCHGARLTAGLDDPEPDVRAAAALGIATDPARRAEAGQRIGALLAGTTADRVALAHAIRRSPRTEHGETLHQLVGRRERPVVREVLQAWAVAPRLADVGRLLELLEDPHLRGDVRRAILASGDLHLPRLAAALDDPRTPLGVRRHLPRTISKLRTPAAAAVLVARLAREPDGTTEFKILRALGRMRADAPSLAIDHAPVRAYARRSLEDALRYAGLSRRLRDGREASGPTAALLEQLLVEKRRHAIERVFRALGIEHPRADMRSVHDALISNDDDRAAAARELLEGLVPADVRSPLLALVEGSTPETAMEGSALAALLVDHSEAVRCLAAHLVAEARLVERRGDLVRLRPTTSSPLVLHAIDQAIARLDARS